MLRDWVFEADQQKASTQEEFPVVDECHHTVNSFTLVISFLRLSGTLPLQHLLVPNKPLGGWVCGMREKGCGGPSLPREGGCRGDLTVLQMRKLRSVAERGFQPRLQGWRGWGCRWRRVNTFRDPLQIPS